MSRVWATVRRARRKLMPGRLTARRLGAAVAVLAVIAATAAGLTRVRIDTGFESFLPAGDPALHALEDKARSFGGDPTVVLMESQQPQQLLLDQQQLPKLLGLEGRLAKLPDVAAVYGPATVLNQIAISAQDLLAQISGRRDGIRAAAEQQARDHGASPAAVTKAGQDAVSGFDQRYGSLLVQGLPAGLPTLHNPHFVQTAVYDRSGNPRPQWQFILPSRDSVAILVRPRAGLDGAGTQRLAAAVTSAVRDAGLSTRRVTVTGVPTVTAALASQVQREVPLVGGMAVGAIALCFLLVPRLGRRRARPLPLLITMAGTAVTLAVIGWLNHPVSLGVVAFLPILLGIGSDFPLYLARPGRRRRVVLAAAASVAGFAALTVSPLPFVRELGLALALGLVCTVAIALLLRGPLRALQPTGVQAGTRESTVAGARSPSWRARVALLAVLGVVAGGGWAVLPRIGIEADPQQLARGLPALDQAEYAQHVLGSSGEVSVLVNGNDVLTPEALSWSRLAESAVLARYGDRLRPVVTAPDLMRFLGDAPTPDQIASAMQLLPGYLSSTVVRPDRRSAMMVFGIQLQDLGEQRRLLDDLRGVLPPAPPGLSVTVAGLPVAAVRGYELVSGGRYAANVLGILAAGLVLLAGLRRRSDAGRAVLAAALATGWVLAGTWAVGASLNPLSVALGSLTTATACEYVVLLTGESTAASTWARRSVTVACLSALIGYLALTVSGLSFLRDFGVLLALSVAVSYLAALAVVWLLPPSGRDPADGAAVTPAGPRDIKKVVRV